MTLLQCMMVAALLTTGMGVALLGSIKVHLARRLEMDEAQVGGLVSVFGFTIVPSIFSVGFLTDHIGRQPVLIAGSLVLAGSLALLAYARSYGTVLAAIVLLSAGWSLLVNVANVLTPAAFGGLKAYAFNLANVLFGMGAFLTPLAAGYFLSRASLRTMLAVLAGFSLLPGLLALGVSFPPIAAPLPGEAAGLNTLLADPVMWLCGLVMFFYGPLEASLVAWATTLLGERGIGEETAATFLSVFWFAFMGSRLLTAFTLPAGAESVLIVVLAFGCVGVLTAIVICRKRAVAGGLIVAAGAVFGPIFPTLMAILLSHFAEPVQGRAVGILFAIGGVGWTLIPIGIGAYARRTSVQHAFSIAILSAVAMVLAGFGKP